MVSRQREREFRLQPEASNTVITPNRAGEYQTTQHEIKSALEMVETLLFHTLCSVSRQGVSSYLGLNLWLEQHWLDFQNGHRKY